MTDAIASIIVAVITPLITAGMGYIVYLLKKKDKDGDNSDKAMMMLLRRELRETYKEMSSKTSITIEELEEFDEIYDVYHELGGNGTGTKMRDYVHQIKVKG